MTIRPMFLARTEAAQPVKPALAQPVQLTESEKHSFVRATMKHHGIDHHVHTALVADLIYGLEALAQPAKPARTVTDADVDAAINATKQLPNNQYAKTHMRHALEAFAAALTQQEQPADPVAFATEDGRVAMRETVETEMHRSLRDTYNIPLYAAIKETP